MEITITTPGLLFPAISLLMLAYTNRFLAISNLIRNLYARYKENNEVTTLRQIKSLKRRVELIKNMQFLGVFSLFLCVLCIILLFLGEKTFGKIIFGTSLFFFMASLALSMSEIQLSIDALNILLSEMKEFAEEEPQFFKFHAIKDIFSEKKELPDDDNSM
ncbi:MAG: DUF2721 domain-containing protein [Cytophagales bacterium]|nr:DUF2721 domain-containing protein [Cytophagales bacterium]MDW8384243.1 DUF2721 domain-containing protein [Flammeovirgaceae bacterium]